MCNIGAFAFNVGAFAFDVGAFAFDVGAFAFDVGAFASRCRTFAFRAGNAAPMGDDLVLAELLYDILRARATEHGGPCGIGGEPVAQSSERFLEVIVVRMRADAKRARNIRPFVSCEGAFVNDLALFRSHVSQMTAEYPIELLDGADLFASVLGLKMK